MTLLPLAGFTKRAKPVIAWLACFFTDCSFQLNSDLDHLNHLDRPIPLPSLCLRPRFCLSLCSTATGILPSTEAVQIPRTVPYRTASEPVLVLSRIDRSDSRGTSTPRPPGLVIPDILSPLRPRFSPHFTIPPFTLTSLYNRPASANRTNPPTILHRYLSDRLFEAAVKQRIVDILQQRLFGCIFISETTLALLFWHITNITSRNNRLSYSALSRRRDHTVLRSGN